MGPLRSLLLPVLLLGGAPALTAQTVFGVDYAGDAYFLNVANGTTLALGPTGALSINGLAHTPAGDLLAVSEGTDELVRFDVNVGVATPLLPVPADLTLRGLAYRPADGLLYLIRGQELWTLDPETGDIDVVGFTGQFNTQGLAFDLEGRLLGINVQLGLVEFDVDTGALTDLFPNDPAGGVVHQYLTLAPDGTLYLGTVDLHSIDPTTGVVTPVQTFFQGPTLLAAEVLPEPLGLPNCNGQPNSTGVPAELALTGWPAPGLDGLHVRVGELPADRFGYVLGGRFPGFAPFPGGSQGILCLGLPLARFTDGLQSSGPAGTFAYDVPLTAVPLAGGTVAALPGETWYFQAWYRDANPGPTSNFSSSLGVVLR